MTAVHDFVRTGIRNATERLVLEVEAMWWREYIWIPYPGRRGADTYGTVFYQANWEIFPKF